MKTLIRSFTIFCMACVLFCGLFSPTNTRAGEGNIDGANKYAWSENAGWLNFRPTDGGVTVHDAYLSGYAWAENIGWVKLGSGIGPYGNATNMDWGVNRDSATGNLSGYAWSEIAGWINFDSTNSQVVVDPVDGSFYGYAWSENVGWIHFKYDDPTYNVAVVTPIISDFSPTFGGSGEDVTITGTNFTGATAVKFGGTAASSFNVDSAAQITAVVGSGATGRVTVTTPGGTATSTSDFTYTAAAAGTYYVNMAIGNDANDGSAAHPWKTLHHAISQLNGGGVGTYVLHVALGTYRVIGSLGEADIQMVLSQSNVTIIGESPSAPIIDGTTATSWTKGIEITGSNNVLRNLYVTGFSGTDPVGEGIRISDGTTTNEVAGCTVYGNNFGIRIDHSTNSKVQGCEIYQNSTHGIDIILSSGTTVVENVVYGNPQYGIRAESSPNISRNLIYDNLWGILVEAFNNNTASPVIKNNVIYKSANGVMDYGIFLRSDSTDPNVSNVSPLIYHNTIDGGTESGIVIDRQGNSTAQPSILFNIITNFGQYGIQNSGANPAIEYNDVWHNTVNNYAGVEVISDTNISEDPLYSSYSLQPESPCINTIPSSEEDPAILDYPGFKRPRPGKTTKDMGAYEYVADVINEYTLPGGTGVATDYRIFTVPLKLGTGAEMLSAMEDVLGPYDPTRWRGFLYTGSIYREFNSSQFATYTIKPGMGFWIITTYTNQIPFQGGPAPDGVDYVMELEPGWHLIGLPWVSTQISLGNMSVTDGVNTYPVTGQPDDKRLTLEYVWDYTGGPSDNGYVKRYTPDYLLQYNTGYFFKILAETSVKLIIPHTEAQERNANSGYITPDQTNSNEDDEAPPPPPGAAPLPDIKANGQDGPVTVPSGSMVSVTVALDPGNWAGRNADWWVAAYIPFAPPYWYTYVYPTGWQAGISACVQGPLSQLSTPFEVLNAALPDGNYTLYFAVDNNTDGIPDATWLDSVEVLVE